MDLYHPEFVILKESGALLWWGEMGFFQTGLMTFYNLAAIIQLTSPVDFSYSSLIDFISAAYLEVQINNKDLNIVCLSVCVSSPSTLLPEHSHLVKH